MKKILYGVTMLALLAAMGCGNSTIRSAEIYLQQSDGVNARRVINEGLPTIPNGSVKAEAYSMLAQITSEELANLENQAKRATDEKDIQSIFEKRLDKVKQFNDEVNNSLQNGNEYFGRLDTMKENLWIDFFNAGVIPFNEKKWKQSIYSFELAWTLDSVKHPTSASLLGQAELQQPSHELSAVSWLKRAIANEMKDSPDYVSRFNLANYYYTSSNWQSAVDYYDQIIAMSAPKPDPKMKATDSAAVRIFNNHLKDFKTKQNMAIANKAISLNQLGRNQEALAAYDTAIKEQPDNSVLVFNLGQLYFDAATKDTTKGAIAKYGKADELFTRVLALDSTDIDATYLLGLTKFQEEKYDEAEKYLRSYVKAKPDKESAWVTLSAAIGNEIVAMENVKGHEAEKKALRDRLKAVQDEMAKNGTSGK